MIETFVMKKLKDSLSGGFTISNDWLEKWKVIYTIRETCISNKAYVVSVSTVKG